MPRRQFSVLIYVWCASHWGDADADADADAGAGASLTSTDRVKDVEETANTLCRFLFDLPQPMSPSVSYEVLINTLWWSWRFPGRFPFHPQAVLKQARHVNVDKSFQDWCHGVFKASLSLRRAPTRLMYLYFNLSQTDLCDMGLAFRCEDYVFIPFIWSSETFYTPECSVLLLKFVFPRPPSLNQVEFKAAYLDVFMRLKWKWASCC